MNLIQNINQEIIDEFNNDIVTVFNIMDEYSATPVSFINEENYYLFTVIINNNDFLYYRRLLINVKTMKVRLVKFDYGTMYKLY